MEINEEAINIRLAELDSLLQNTRYARQKSKLQLELEGFLRTLTPSRTLADAFPSDIRKFLALKDQKGKTIVHAQGCSFRGRQNIFHCGCPLRRSAASVDSLIGQLRAIFRDYGRGGIWSEPLGAGNPAAAPCVKSYLSAVRLEQTAASVVPKQATPLFHSKLSLISRHISFKLRNPKNSITQEYLLRRDLTFFNVLSYTGDRAGDLATLVEDQIYGLPDNAGISFTLTKGKTVRMGEPRVVYLYRSDDAEFCPVKLLRSYLAFCRENGLVKDRDYVFRTLDGTGALSERPISSSSTNARLKLYLRRFNLWNGETPHSMRSACAITLAHLGVDRDMIKAHVGWKSDAMLDHYTKRDQISKKAVAAHAISTCSKAKFAGISAQVDLYKGKGSLI